jgi:IS1 family transposase
MSVSITGAEGMAQRLPAYVRARVVRALKWMKCTPGSGLKNPCWLWRAVDRQGKRFLDGGGGSRGTETGQKLRQAIQSNTVTEVMSDCWRPYETLFRNSYLPRQRLKRIRWKATIASVGISLRGCAGSPNAMAKARKCLTIP